MATFSGREPNASSRELLNLWTHATDFAKREVGFKVGTPRSTAKGLFGTPSVCGRVGAFKVSFEPVSTQDPKINPWSGSTLVVIHSERTGWLRTVVHVPTPHGHHVHVERFLQPERAKDAVQKYISRCQNPVYP